MIKKFKIIIAIAITMLLVFPSIIFASWPNPNVPEHILNGQTYKRNGGASFKSIAQLYGSDEEKLTVESKYNANVTAPKSVKVYKYKTTELMTCDHVYNSWNAMWDEYDAHPEINYLQNTNNFQIHLKDVSSAPDYQMACATIRIPENADATTDSYTNIATVVYEDGLLYNGKKYTIKADINKVSRQLSEFNNTIDDGILGDNTIYFNYGYIEKSNSDKTNLSSYITSCNEGKNNIYPIFYISEASEFEKRTSIELDIDYTILDSEGNEAPVSGLLSLSSLGRTGGVFLKNIKATNTNSYIRNNNTNDNLYYIANDAGTFIFGKHILNEDSNVAYSTVYPSSDSYRTEIKLDNISKYNVVLVSDGLAFGTPVVFSKALFNINYQIATSVTNGTIDNTVSEITAGDTKTIKFAPTDATKQQLEAILIDGEPIDITGNETQYTFNDIQAFHSIDVKYSSIPEDKKEEEGNKEEDKKENENKTSDEQKEDKKDDKKDDTQATKIIPQTGAKSLVLIILAIVVVAGILYRKTKKM